MSKVCLLCGSPRPKGRTKYCGDDCLGASINAREQKRRASRLAACMRCQGPKELGTRGGKYCAECRRIIADTATQYEQERARRRSLATIDQRIKSGPPFRRRQVDAPEGQKWCARCQSYLPFSSFPKRTTGKPAAYCIPCQRSFNTERRMRLNFGLTWEEYELLFAMQDYRCAICNGRPRKHMLSVDHDHQTGEIRGLLCSRCNHKLLGSANDDPARLRKAADYLEAFEPRAVFGEPRYVPGSLHEQGEAS